GDDVFIKQAGGDRFNDENIQTQDDVAKAVQFVRERKARNNQPAEAPTPQAVDSTSEAKPKVVELDGQKIRLSPSQQSVLQKANEKYPGKISADRLNGISQNTLNSLREKGLLEESGNVYNRSFKISSKGRRVNRRVLASEKEDT